MKSISEYFPLIVIFMGAVLAAGGALWQGIRQRASTRESSAVTKQVVDTLQDMAAREGNTKLRAELVDARTRVLEGRATPSSMNDLLVQLPQLTADFQRQNQDKARIMEDMATDMDLCWTPTFRFLVQEFDRLVAEANQRGFNIILDEKQDMPPITVSEPNVGTTKYVRKARVGKVSLVLSMQPGTIFPTGMRAVTSDLTVLGENPRETRILSLMADFNEGNCSIQGKATPKPKDGIPPKELTEGITKGVANGIARLLVMAKAAEDNK